MSAMAMVVMIGICTLVWGGFALLLTRAVRRERRKVSARRASDTDS